MRSVAAIVCSLAAAAAPLACSALVNLDDTIGGHADAGVDADGDAGSDSGAVDAAPDAAFPPGSWCASQPPGMLLCDDFDTAPLGARWTSLTFDVAGSYGLSPAHHVSAPNGLSIAIANQTSGTYFREMLDLRSPTAIAGASFAFDLFPVTFPTLDDAGTFDAYVATIEQGPGHPRSALSLEIGPTLARLQQQLTDANGADTFKDAFSTIVPPAGAWVRAQIDLDFSVSPPTATLSFDGKTGASIALDSSWTTAVTTFHLGDWYLGDTSRFEVAYDDAVIRITK